VAPGILKNSDGRWRFPYIFIKQKSAFLKKKNLNKAEVVLCKTKKCEGATYGVLYSFPP
jgi:hypothetical protein